MRCFLRFGLTLPIAYATLPAMRAVLAFAILLVLVGLRAPLLEPEEARYAEIPRQMLAADRWLVPVLNGQDYLDKPPLAYWLVMASYQLFGVHDWSARLAAGLVWVATVGIVMLWARQTSTRAAALVAGLVLVTLPEFAYRGRFVTPNGLLALCTTAGLAFGHFARLGPNLRLGWWLASAIAVGLGILTKGPVALVLVVPPLGLVGWLDRRLAHVNVKHWLLYGFAAIAIPAPWFVAVAWRCPGFLEYFFWFHHVVRYTSAFDHAKPAWFYLPQIALGLAPWGLLLPGLAVLVIHRRGRCGPAGLGLLAGVWAILFFSAADSKRPVYLVPAVPPIALALGIYLPLWARRFARHRLALRRLALGWSALVLAGVALAWPVYADRFSLADLGDLVKSSDLPIVCYPQSWEAIEFYSGRTDVQSFTLDEQPQLIAELNKHRAGCYLLLKRHRLEEIPGLVPKGLVAEAELEKAGVTAYRLRPQAKPTGLARDNAPAP